MDIVVTKNKIGFMKEQSYTPPVYRGNIPAGYLISNTNDNQKLSQLTEVDEDQQTSLSFQLDLIFAPLFVAKWLKIQLGKDSSNGTTQQGIQKSHIPDQSVEPFDMDTYYANGWTVMKKTNNIFSMRDRIQQPVIVVLEIGKQMY
ncbi:hypothetical protein ACSVDA_19425 [Cytobacillus sp. Hm23]